MNDHRVEDLLRLQNIEKVVLDNTEKHIAALVTDTYREYKKKKFNKHIYIFNEGMSVKQKIDGTGIISIDISDTGKLVYADIRGIHIVGDEGLDLNIKFEGGIQQAKWFGDKVLFSATIKKHNGPGDAYFFEENVQLNELYLLDLSKGIKKITENVHIWEFDCDDNNIYAVTSDQPMESCWYGAVITRISLDGRTDKIYDPDYREVGKITVHGDKVAFLESIMSDRGVISGDIILLENGHAKNITEGSSTTYSHIEFAGDSMYALENKMSTFTLRNMDNGKAIWEGSGIIYPVFTPAFSTNGNVFVFAYSNEKQVSEVIRLESGKIAQSKINNELKNLKAYPSELVEWKSSDEMDIYGFFRSEKPENPVVVYIHGGPTSFSYPAFIDRTTLYLGAGFSVFLPNYRGSIGKGREYAESNRGDMGGMDFEDIISGIDYLKKQGKIKTDRIYITGGSYGGYMSAIAIMKTDIFKASVSLYGISDWVSFHGVSILYNWDRIHMNEDPYKYNKYDKFSAIRINHDVKTPILLMHGVEDPYVPIGQYYEFYRFLKEHGKMVKLLVYPREGHGFTEKEHMITQYKETIAFFNKYP